MLKIAAISSALPERVVNSDEIAEAVGADALFINNKIGIRERRFLAQNETVTSLAQSACEKLIQKAGISIEDIDLLILVTQNGDYQLPHGAALLQDALGLPTSVASFDIALGCSGFVYGLVAAKSFAEAIGANNVILVTCDPYSKSMSWTDRNTMSIFGDAAAATLLSTDGTLSVHKGDFGTDGSGASGLIIERDSAEDGEGIYCTSGTSSRKNCFIQMDGRAIYNFMMTKIPRSVNNCIEKNRIVDGHDEKFEPDLYVFHQASKFMLESLASTMKLPIDKVPIRLDSIGNTVSSTIPMVLEALMDEGKTEKKKIVISGFGVGLSWGTLMLKG